MTTPFLIPLPLKKKSKSQSPTLHYTQHNMNPKSISKSSLPKRVRFTSPYLTPVEPKTMPTHQVPTVSIANDGHPIPAPEEATKENKIRDAPSEDPTPIPQGKRKHDYPNLHELDPQTTMQNHGDDCLATAKRIIDDMDIGLERYIRSITPQSVIHY